MEDKKKIHGEKVRMAAFKKIPFWGDSFTLWSCKWVDIPNL
jgi:hypothetical protein